MNFFQKRRYKKIVRHLLHDARHALHMRGDVAPAAKLDALHKAQADLEEAWQGLDEQKMEAAGERIAAGIQEVYPARPQAKIRENLEILVVALSIAMAFRTYFIQPFKIPTGSMQPTLYGVWVEPRDSRTLMDIFPISLVNLIVFGERYQEIKARTSGQVEMRITVSGEDYDVCFVGDEPHRIPKNMKIQVSDNSFVAQGQVLASGRVRFGDHIFVDKIRYNFSRPERGDIFVFSTEGINFPGVRTNTFYIKRLVGLPGEEVSIHRPHLVINGENITEPYPFHRMLTDTNYPGGYNYAHSFAVNARLLKPTDAIKLGPAEYLPMGDNTMQSLDGRYFGPVPENNIVGPAFCVYWPFSKRWGRVQ